jgi:hypothetical protein
MRSAHRWLSAAALVFALAGCNGEVVVGGQKDVDAYATGDGTSGGGSASLAPAYAVRPGGPVATHLGGSLAGTVTFQARVELVDAAGDAVALAPSPAGGTVRLDGHDTVFVASRTVLATRYPRVRVTFTQVAANVTGGLVIGNVNVTGQVQVGVPGGGVVVERAVDLGDDDEDVEILIDLDASAWLPSVNLATRVVPAADFRSAVKVRRI